MVLCCSAVEGARLAHRWCHALALRSWHAYGVLLPPQAGQTQQSSQYPSIQSCLQCWHQALRISWPLPSWSPAWHFLEQLLCRVPADVPRQKLLPSQEDERPQGRGTSGEEHRDKGGKSIRAKRGVCVLCRGSRMRDERLERSSAVCSPCCSGAG